jgi:hypothetical protein
MKTLFVKLPLKQKLVFGAIAVVVLGGVLTTGVIALTGNSQSQAVKTAPVAHVKKTPTKKVADASTTTPVATPQPAATAQPAATPAPAPTPCPNGGKPITRNGEPACFGANRTVAPSNPAPTAPRIIFTPTTVTYNIFGHSDPFISEIVGASSDFSTKDNPTIWSYSDPSGNFVATLHPVNNADTGVQRGAWLQFAYPSFGPDRAGSYPITVTVTDTTTGLSSMGTFTIVAN